MEIVFRRYPSADFALHDGKGIMTIFEADVQLEEYDDEYARYSSNSNEGSYEEFQANIYRTLLEHALDVGLEDTLDVFEDTNEGSEDNVIIFKPIATEGNAD